MQSLEDWIEENFERQPKSMPGSCISVDYVPKRDGIPPWPPRSRVRFNMRALAMSGSVFAISLVLVVSVVALLAG